MTVNFQNSITKDNLMRAFAGESQARNRYTFAASKAKKQKLQVVEAVFNFTAGQEKEHAEIFYKHLGTMTGQTITVDGGFPVEVSDDTLQLLRFAQHDEYEEHGCVYPAFAQKAREEGFIEVAKSFELIGAIEKTHGDRFAMFADMLEQNKLFVSDVEVGYLCLNCGHIHAGTSAPAVCPVCDHAQGYFIRLELAPYVK